MEKERLTVRKLVTFPESVVKRLEAFADSEGESDPYIVRRAVIEFLEKRGF